MEWFFEFIRNADPVWMYTGLFLGCYIENVFSPFPGDSVVVLGAYLVGTGTLRFDMVFISTTVGSMIGFGTIFAFGRFAAEKWISTGRLKLVNSKRYRLTEKWFEKYGYWIIIANRFLSGIRSVISLFAGISNLSTIKVLLYALVSTIIWHSILIYAGLKLGENWEQVETYIKKYNVILFSALGLIALFIIIRWFIKRKKTD
ncbi:MAG: DedA family protein [bacterium]|nr:DedA family protein [bacterium]